MSKRRALFLLAAFFAGHLVLCSRKLFLLAALLIFTSVPAFADHPIASPQHILIIHSFHKDFPWTAKQGEGIKDVLSFKESIIITETYLDALNEFSNRTSTFESPSPQEAVLQYKRTSPPSLIITTDEDAFYYWDTQVRTRFPQTPHVFSGLILPPESPQARLLTSGVLATPDWTSMLPTMWGLHPHMRTLVALTSKSRKGNAALINFSAHAKAFSSRLNITKKTLRSAHEATELTEHMTTRAIIAKLFLPLLPKAKNKHTARSPIYSAFPPENWELIAGGQYFDPHQIGAMAGNIALAILNGTPAHSIPYRHVSQGEFIVNSSAIMQTGALPDTLPEGAAILWSGEDIPIKRSNATNPLLIGIILLFCITGFFSYISWERLRKALIRKNAAALAHSQLTKAASTNASLQEKLVHGALEATGGTLGYLALVQPAPLILLYASRYTESGTPKTKPISTKTLPPELVLFWEPILDGNKNYIIAESKSSSWEHCAFPFPDTPIKNHLAISVKENGKALYILGLANCSSCFTCKEITTASSLLEHFYETYAHEKQALETSRTVASYTTIFNTTPLALCIMNESGMIHQTNTPFKALYELDEFGLQGNIQSVIAPKEYKRFNECMNGLSKGATEAVVEEMTHIKISGASFHAKITLQPLDTPGTDKYLMAVEDISKLKAAQEHIETYQSSLESMVLERTVELKNALSYAESTRDRIDMILKSVGDGLLVTDMHNRIILMNRKAEELLTTPLSHAIGLQIGQILQGRPFRALLEERVARSRQGDEHTFEFTIPAGNTSKEIFIRANTSCVLDMQGAQRGVVAIMHDATKERELDKMKSEFISMAAHELRTPLTTVQGFSELLLSRRDMGEDERTRFLDHINNSAQILSGIVSDLLDISRIESGIGFTLTIQEVDIAPLLREQIDLNKERYTSHMFTASIPDAPALSLVDPMKFKQIITNLLSNAIKYSPNGGNISLTLETDASMYLITVTDTGIGMTEEQVARVFEKFYRANAEDGAIQGTGLGLPIVKHLVEAHGGEIWIESVPEEGTTVSLTLPTAQVAAARPVS